MSSLLEMFELWLNERINRAQTSLLERIAALETEVQELRTATPCSDEHPSFGARLEEIENKIEELDNRIDNDDTVEDKVDGWMHDNLDDRVVDTVRNLTFSVEVSRY